MFLPHTFQDNGSTQPLSTHRRARGYKSPSHARDPLQANLEKQAGPGGWLQKQKSVWTWGTRTKLQIIEGPGLSDTWVRVRGGF